MLSERVRMATTRLSRPRSSRLLYMLTLCMCFVAMQFATVQAKPPGKPLLHPGVRNRVAAPASTGAAIRTNAGFNTNTLPANDDGYTGLVPIGFGINFAGQTWQNLYVNNNGNVTFNYGLSTYTPFSLASSTIPMIAPFFADVDTRGTGSNVVTYGNDTVDGHNAFGVNWINVGYYNQHVDKLNSFQMVLIDRSDIGPGDFDTEFNYNTILWETGDASGGQDGFGGTPVRAGYTDGTTTANGWLELAGSGISGAMLDGGPDSLVAGSLDSGGVAGRYVFHFRNEGITLLDENPARYGSTVSSAAADGATEVRVRCQVGGPGVVSLALNNGVSSQTPSGTFVPAPGFGNDLTNMTVQQVGNNYYADAIYTVPEGLVNETTHDISFGGSFTPSGGQPDTLESQTLQLQRPPVILVHGLWSSGDTWSAAGAMGMLTTAGFHVYTFDYSYTNASHFGTNAQLLTNYIVQVLSTLRNAQTAVARADIVCHSMGGDITRTMVARQPAYMSNTFGMGLIHRFVTLGTPHYGSPWANLLWGLHNLPEGGPVVDYLASSVGYPIDQGAVEDLQQGSTALLNMGATNASSFALIGDIDPTNITSTTLINFIYQVCVFMGYQPVGVDTSSAVAFINSIMNNQANDGIVTGPSQAGGLSSQYTQLFEGVFHTQEPGSSAMGTEATTLLSGPVSAFAAGFPAITPVGAGHAAGLEQGKCSNFRALSSTPLITITSPAANSTFNSGDQVTITATPVSGANVQAVLFTISDGSGNSVLVQQAPFTATFTIANNFVGTLTFSAVARDNAGNVSMTNGTATVQTTATLQSITVSPSPVVFSSIGQTQQLQVMGSYSDGVQRDVTAAAMNTYYSADDSTIVNVSNTGLATAQSAGNTLLHVSNGSVNTQIVGQVSLQTPQVLAVSPATVAPGATGATLTIQGLYLGGATGIVFMNGSQQDSLMTTGALQVDAAGQTLTTTLNVDASDTPGGRTVIVTTPGGSASSVAGTGNQITVKNPNFTLSVTKSGQGSGDVSSTPTGIDCGSTCSAPFTIGSSVQLTEQATSGGVFEGWSGCTQVSNNVCTVTMGQDMSVNANFAPAGSGLCGSANGQSFLKVPKTTLLCSAGKASRLSGKGPWSWSCAGSKGGVTVNCSASLQVNGFCGTSNGKSFLSTPTSNLCKSGTASVLSGTGPWNWTCAGANGGTSASCTAKLKVNGSCGSANKGNFFTQPGSSLLCSAGSASAVTGKGPWKWSCAGLNGGMKARCSANLEVNGVCGSANGQTLTKAPKTNLCVSGKASRVTGGGPWNWACAGSNGGTSQSCSANK